MIYQFLCKIELPKYIINNYILSPKRTRPNGIRYVQKKRGLTGLFQEITLMCKN